jgi:hypothetical protein
MSRQGSIGWRSLIAFLCLLCAPLVQAEGKLIVTALLSEGGGLYDELAADFANALGAAYDLQTKAVDDLEAAQLRRLNQPGSLIAPVGIKACSRVLALNPVRASVLCLMVSKAGFDSLITEAATKERVSAVFIDQPPSRSIALVRLLLPDARRIGVLQSDETASQIAGLRQQAEQANFSLVVEPVKAPSEVPEALQRLLPKIDAFLLQPDSNVVNGNTLRYILLASYRQKVSVIGFSRGMVNAGAVAAVTSEPAAIAQQGAAMVRQWNPVTGTIPAAGYASGFTLVFNYPVARSLGIAYPLDSQTISRWRRAMGE